MDFSWIGASAAYGVQHQLLLSAIVSNLKMEMEPQWQVSHKRITPVKLCESFLSDYPQIWLARIFLRIWRGFSAEARRVDMNLLGRLGSVNITNILLSLRRWRMASIGSYGKLNHCHHHHHNMNQHQDDLGKGGEGWLPLVHMGSRSRGLS